MNRNSMILASLASATMAALFVCTIASAQTQIFYPQLRGINPVALQTGTTAELVLSSSNDLRGATQVIVSGAGVSGEIVPPDPPAEPKPGEAVPPLLSLRIRFTAAVDAVPGPRQVRLMTPRGASTLVEVHVVRDAVFVERGDNNTVEKAQLLEKLPLTVCGQMEAKEDVDYFRFRVEAPGSLAFHVWAQRLQHPVNDLRGRRFIDPILTLRSGSGAVLAANDNYFNDDPLLVYAFSTPGEYVLEIRDTRYHGWGEYWPYAIEINARPQITQVFPACVFPGVETRLSLVGQLLPADPTVSVNLSADEESFRRFGDRAMWTDRVQWISPSAGGVAANAVPVALARYPVTVEAESDNDRLETAQAIMLPTVIAGRIASPGDVDCYRFAAKANDLISFECIGRRVGSLIDSSLRILNAKGEQLVEADDRRYSLFTITDSELEGWKVPANGEYFVEMRDVAANGGPEFVYALSVSQSEPRFLLEANSDKTVLAPGIASPIFVRAERRNGFAGDIQLAVDGLPPGVTAECGRILAGGQDGAIILRAAADSKHAAANVRISGTAQHALADGANLELSALARPLSEIMQDGGGRGLVPVSMHTVSISDPMEVRGVKLSAPALSIKPGESQKIEITVERAPGYRGNISLDGIFQHLTLFADNLPPKVTIDAAGSKTILTGEDCVGHITFKADADALPAESHLVPIMAHVTVNFTLKLTFCEGLKMTVEQK